MQMYALRQVDVTSELLHSWWFAHAQSNDKTINVWLQIQCYTQNHNTLTITYIMFLYYVHAGWVYVVSLQST